jgi:protein-disulfide isomerase
MAQKDKASARNDADDSNSGKWIFMASAAILAAAAATTVFFWQSSGSAQGQVTDANETARAAGIDADEQAAFEALIEQYILDNPEIIPQAIERLRTKQAAQRIDGIRGQIETPFANASFAGNPNGDVVLVEYSDFACGFCRKSVGDVQRLIDEDPNLKVVFRELPILSEASADAAAWALAAARQGQGKYYAFHKAMFKQPRPDKASIQAAAQAAGLDIGAAQAFVATPAVQQELQQNVQIAQQLEFTGTPSWVVGDQIFNGAVGFDQLKDAIAATREAKTAG